MDCNHNIRFLIVDDNRELCDILQSYFDLVDGIDLCGIAYNGEEALRKIARLQPDVILLDIIMPQLDGLSVLEKLQDQPPEHPPRVIVASAIGQEVVTNRALALGANYYMIKPIQLPDLENRIRLIGQTQPKTSNSEIDLPSVIAKYLMDLHMPTHVLGYQYCVQAIAILIHENKRCPLAKHVYRQIADKNDTSVPCVESAIRKAISFTVSSGQHSASNGTFLTAISEKIKLELSRSAAGGNAKQI